jgi:hypothetical protein
MKEYFFLILGTLFCLVSLLLHSLGLMSISIGILVGSAYRIWRQRSSRSTTTVRPTDHHLRDGRPKLTEKDHTP